MSRRIGNYKSMSDAATAAGINRQNLWKMLNGKEKITMEMCFRFCRAWDMPLSEIIKLFYPAEYEENKKYIECISVSGQKNIFEGQFLPLNIFCAFSESEPSRD